jgi:hypothetical protein
MNYQKVFGSIDKACLVDRTISTRARRRCIHACKPIAVRVRTGAAFKIITARRLACQKLICWQRSRKVATSIHPAAQHCLPFGEDAFVDPRAVERGAW